MQAVEGAMKLGDAAFLLLLVGASLFLTILHVEAKRRYAAVTWYVIGWIGAIVFVLAVRS